MSRGKAITKDASISHPSPTSGNASILQQHGQVFITDDSLLAVGWIARAEQYFTLHQTFENL